MNSKHIVRGLVIAVTILFSMIYAALGNYVLTLVAFGLGGLWLTLDARIEGSEGTLFFLAFVALAMIATFYGTLGPLPVFGLSINLAAWDMSRFVARLTDEKDPALRAVLETRHQVILMVVISLGFLIALLPFLFQLAIPFVIVCGMVLLTLLMLQQSMRRLSPD